MGRITIFSIEDCKYCRLTKAAMSSRGIPYTDINIEAYPSKRADMISLANKLTVPQVFFNDEHIGGSEETLTVLTKWDEDIAQDGCVEKTPYDRYVREIESKPDSTDVRLMIPDGPSAIKTMDFSTSRTLEMFQLGDKKYTTLEFTKLLIDNMPRDSLTYWGVMYYNCFTGFSGVTALQDMFKLESREDAVQLGLRLQRKHYLSHVCKDHPFGDNEFYYRLQPFCTPNVLNSFRVWVDKVDEKPVHVMHRLAELWGRLESQHLTADGKVDHANIRNDELYWKFEEDICELQKIDLYDMNENTRMAFVINLYNLLVKYAFCKVGIPATSTDRASFFGDVSINVGGRIFSLDDIEHGILRANTRHPYQMSKRFGMIDPRKRLALKCLDPRVHFALNCGAKSCPPVKRYTSESLDEELRLSAIAFCEDDNNVTIDEENCQLRLNKILFWYMKDFVESKSNLPLKVSGYLHGEKKELLNKLMQEGNVDVKFLDYDWSSNDINTLTYSKGDLIDKSIFPYSPNPPQRYVQK